MKQQSDLLTGSLLIRESRHIARLLRVATTEDQWDAAIVRNNILQKKTVSTAKRVTRGLRRRLATLDSALLNAIEFGDDEFASQVTLSAVLLQNPILLTFFEEVLAESMLHRQETLHLYQWDDHVKSNLDLNPAAAIWSTTSGKKARQIVVRILWEAGYISDTRSRRLQKVALRPELQVLLATHGHTRALNALNLKLRGA